MGFEPRDTTRRIELLREGFLSENLDLGHVVLLRSLLQQAMVVAFHQRDTLCEKLYRKWKPFPHKHLAAKK